jgi:hypothetical protein
MSSDTIDWESVLGLPKDSIDDELKGTGELNLSAKLFKVRNPCSCAHFSATADIFRRKKRFSDIALMKTWAI